MTLADYRQFIASKAQLSTSSGFPCEPSEVHPILKPHQAAMVCWAVRGGRRALFGAFGLGKTVVQLETTRLILEKSGGGRGLIVLPLGVRQEFTRDAAMLGMSVRFIRSIDEADRDGIYLTNYETVRDGKLDPRQFTVLSLDEAGVLRGFGGTKTFRELMKLFEGTATFRFVATATPSPNEFIELLAYAAFLDIMDVGQAKTRWFKRNTEKADALTLHPHKEAEFWLWVASWALFVQAPSDLGYSDEGYVLPPLDVRWHMVPTDHARATADSSGQTRLFANAALGVVDAAREKRLSLPERIAKLMEIIKDGIHGPGSEAGVFQGVLPGAQGAISSARTGQSGRSREDGSGEGTASGVARAEPRGLQRETTGSLRNGYAVQAAEGHKQATDVASQIRADQVGIRRDAGEPIGPMPDLPRANEDSGRGSRSPDGSREGPSLPGMQCSTGLVPGQPGDAGPRGGVSDDQWVIWADLNDEQRAIESALGTAGVSCTSLYGSQDIGDREDLLNLWRAKQTAVLLTKPSMYGAGCNLQQSHRMIFAGIGFKFAAFIQAIHREHRFGQTHPVRIDLIYTEAEAEVRRQLERKWAQHNTLVANMTAIIREYGLSEAAMAAALNRSIGVDRTEESGDGWTLVHNDSVEETHQMEADSVGLILTSVPFSTMYEYSPSYNDFGHTDDELHFWQQMDFLSPELLRVLKPGRNLVVHVKDRIVPSGLTKLGFQTVQPFHCDAIAHYRKHGFAYLGMRTIVTDVVRENNQTYRLGWTEQCKDGTRMGVGMPEYLLLFRKPPTDRSNGYADEPVVKVKPLAQRDGVAAAFDKDDNWKKPIPGTGYSRARWQFDAHGFWRSPGNRLLSADELATLPHSTIYKLWRDRSRGRLYDFGDHVQAAEEMDHLQRLPASFMLLPPHSWHPDVWTDVTRMRTLNGSQWSRGKQMHLCLARGTLVLTRGGYRPIQDVLRGDEVLTHKGRWRRVLIAQNTGVQPVVTIKAQGVPGLTLTPDHKLWTRSVRDIPWARAHSRLDATKADPSWVPADETVGSYVNLKLPPAEPPPDGDARFWWTVGRWLADGHIGGRTGAVISCGRHEVDSLVSALGDYAGNPQDTGTAISILLRDKDHRLRRTLAACGRGADRKHLPSVAYVLPAEQARALLDGYLSGDGHYLPERHRWSASTVSRELALGVAMLAQRAYGATASIYPGRKGGGATIQGRLVATKPEWIVCFDLPGDDRYKGQPFILDDGAWGKVRSAEPAGEVETWNLRVEEDESYTAENCIVKNCPMQFDIADRVIEQMSNPDDLVMDPFSGLGTVVLRALKQGRRGLGVELSASYHADAVSYARAAERDAQIPSLFDALEREGESDEVGSIEEDLLTGVGA